MKQLLDVQLVAEILDLSCGRFEFFMKCYLQNFSFRICFSLVTFLFCFNILMRFPFISASLQELWGYFL